MREDLDSWVSLGISTYLYVVFPYDLSSMVASEWIDIGGLNKQWDTKEEKRMAKKHMKTWFTLYVIKEMQISKNSEMSLHTY